MSDFVQAGQITEAKQALDRLRANMRVTIKGKDDVIEQVLVCLVAGGHLLIEDLPGVGKTTLAYSLARSMDCAFSRIQFTSDLLPGDVTGVAIYDETVKEFVFKTGPGLRERRAGGRDQPRHAEDAVGAARGDGPRARDGGRRGARGRLAVHGVRDAEPGGLRGHVSAAGEPDGPLPDAAADGLPAARPTSWKSCARRARGYDAIALNPVITRADVLQAAGAGARRCSSRTACSTTS